MSCRRVILPIECIPSRSLVQASSEHSISVAIEAAGAAAAKKITEEAFAVEIRSETVAVDVIR